MIKKITVKNIASYDHVGVTLHSLKKINFVYGNNGSGKTTLSEVLRNENYENNPSCEIEWENQKLATYVYNRNFVKENFLQGPIKGIFTLGSESIESQLKINELKQKISEHMQEITRLREGHIQKTSELNDVVSDFIKACWRIKDQIDSEFKDLIKGVRNSQTKFMQKCLEEAQLNQNPLVTIDDIIRRKESLFDRNAEVMHKNYIVKIEEIYERDSIFETKIIGREDVDISTLINILQISDWVKQGAIFIKNSDGVCPFCQQVLPVYFEEKLNNYFDQTYEAQMKHLSDVSQGYIDYTLRVIANLQRIIEDENNTFIKKDKLQSVLNIIMVKVEENKLLIEKKLREPSRVVKLVEINDLLLLVNDEIVASNMLIDEYNVLIENSRAEKDKLVKDAWRYIVELNKDNLKSYEQRRERLDRALTGISQRIQTKEEYKSGYERELIQYQRQIASVQYSVDEINRILTSFGFKNFKLETTTEQGNYKIVRENGEDANETLSEGEKTFITFLYFYRLLRGSNKIEEIISEKIVVIDDPISSLDSSVLFLVSSLVRQLMFDVKNNTSDIKQIILLTHNIYFHKEVSFNQGKKSFGQGTYWILRKKNNKTSVECFMDNPIKTSYELLWKELRNTQGQNFITVQNTMRRILEYYFKFFGDIDLEKLEDSFEIDEKMICRSLLSWINDGSHSVNEDLYVENNIDLLTRYLEVFKDIFYKKNHGAHYEMMMREMSDTVMDQDYLRSREEISQGLQEVASGTSN